MTNKTADRIEEQIQNLTEDQYYVQRSGTSEKYPKYKLYELYFVAVKRGRTKSGTGHESWDVAREASRMTAYRFLSEIKVICPEYYEHFVELANNEMPD